MAVSFDSVEHAPLLDRLGENVPEADLLRLVEAWLTAPVRDGTQLLTPTQGLPQGSPLSPVLANLYLDRFDEALQQKGMRLVRFADDFLILCKERPKAEAALRLTDTLLRKLGLSLDPEKTRITHFDQGFRYLGHLFVRSLVLPSPNRLQRPDPLKDETPAPKAAPRRVQAIRPSARNTALSRAMAEALEQAGREALVVAEPPEGAAPSPPNPAAPAPVLAALQRLHLLRPNALLPDEAPVRFAARSTFRSKEACWPGRASVSSSKRGTTSSWRCLPTRSTRSSCSAAARSPRPL